MIDGSFLPAATRLAASVDAPVVLVGSLRSLETVIERHGLPFH